MGDRFRGLFQGKRVISGCCYDAVLITCLPETLASIREQGVEGNPFGGGGVCLREIQF
jgi:hypothetical protein